MDDRIQTIKNLHEGLKFFITTAIEDQSKYFDLKVQPQPEFKVGDQVWLDSRNLRTDRPAAKLDYKKIGPFRITEQVGSRAFRLELPHHMRIHPVFHVRLLEKYRVDDIPGRRVNRPPPDNVMGEDEFEMDKVLDSKYVRDRLKYKVHWTGYMISDETWEPAENLENSQDLVQEFHRNYPGKPGPALRRARA